MAFEFIRARPIERAAVLELPTREPRPRETRARPIDRLEAPRVNAVSSKWKVAPAGVRIVRNQSGEGDWLEKWRSKDGKWVHNYSLASMAQSADAKFADNRRFARKLPEIRAAYEDALAGGDRRAVVALAVAVVDRTYFRVGNEESDDHGVFGVTTLQNRHVSVRGSVVTFDFVGKKKVAQHRVVEDAVLAKLIAGLKRGGPKERLFSFDGQAVDAAEVNAFLKPFDATAKNFRTYHATRMAREYLLAHPAANAEARAAVEKEMFETVAEALGHTPAVCRQSYVDPRVITAYENGRLRDE